MCGRGSDHIAHYKALRAIIIIIIIITLIISIIISIAYSLIYLLTAIQLSLGGSSPHTNTDKK